MLMPLEDKARDGRRRFDYYNNIFKQLYLNSTIFVQNAQDYFVVTRNTFDWQYVVRNLNCF